MQQVPTAAITDTPDRGEGGLSTQEAQERLTKVGPNEQTPARRTAGLIQILLLFTNPLVIMLLIVSIVSAFVGEIVNASIIALMVVISIVINFVQTWHSQRAAERLRGQVAPTATILRDGTWSELPWREVVPGDVIRLAAGDLVPADARLLHTKDLHVNQAALTGESLPVEKEASVQGAAVVETAAVPSANARNAVFLGTSIVSGTATAVLQYGTGPLWVCEGAFDALALLAAGIPRVVAIYGVQGWCWAWARHIDAVVFALDADPAGQEQWQALARQAALRGKRVAVLPEAGYGGCKDVSEAWAAGVLWLDGGATDLDGTLGHCVTQECQETWTERVAIMVVDGGLPPAEAERCAWADQPAPGAAGAARSEGEQGTAR